MKGYIWYGNGQWIMDIVNPETHRIAERYVLGAGHNHIYQISPQSRTKKCIKCGETKKEI